MASLTGTHAHDLGASAATAAAQPGQREYVAGRAIFAYQSILDDRGVGITATSEADWFAAENVRSRLTSSAWKPADAGEQALIFESDTLGKTIDYLGIAAHNLRSMGASIVLQSSDDGATWADIVSHAPSTDAPFLLTFSEVSKLHFRLVVNVASGAFPAIGVVMLGQRLPLQRALYVGHRPAPFSRDIVYKTAESEGGNIIGRTIIRRFNETSIEIRRITPTWFRQQLLPFQRAAEVQPFFFLWRTDYADEVIYGVIDNAPRPSNEHQSFMAVDYTMRGLA
jgi:hypothetical protein